MRMRTGVSGGAQNQLQGAGMHPPQRVHLRIMPVGNYWRPRIHDRTKLVQRRTTTATMATSMSLLMQLKHWYAVACKVDLLVLGTTSTPFFSAGLAIPYKNAVQ